MFCKKRHHSVCFGKTGFNQNKPFRLNITWGRVKKSLKIVFSHDCSSYPHPPTFLHFNHWNPSTNLCSNLRSSTHSLTSRRPLSLLRLCPPLLSLSNRSRFCLRNLYTHTQLCRSFLNILWILKNKTLIHWWVGLTQQDLRSGWKIRRRSRPGSC